MPLVDAKPDSLARTYATALFELAESKGGEDLIHATLTELEEILELAREDPRFGEFLASRVLSTKDRKKSLNNIFKGKLSDLTLHFLLVLNNKGRVANLPAIAAAVDEITQDRFGKIEVDVYTASPMSGEELAQIKDRLHLALGREPVVHPYVDGSMIGGVKLQIGDKLIDASLATRLRQIQARLANDGANELRGNIARTFEDQS